MAETCNNSVDWDSIDIFSDRMEMVPEEEHFDFEDDNEQICNNGLLNPSSKVVRPESLRRTIQHYRYEWVYIPEPATNCYRAFRKHGGQCFLSLQVAGHKREMRP
jgi:hypothetical protein